MNSRYLQRTVGIPNMTSVTVANPGPNISIQPNYFHFNPKTQKYRMGDDISSLQKAKKWHDCHQVEGEILGVVCTTQVGIVQAEYEKVLAHIVGTPTKIEVDLLEDSLIVQHNPLEILLENANQIKIIGNVYNMKIDFRSGDFHLGNIFLGMIGERFTIELI